MVLIAAVAAIAVSTAILIHGVVSSRERTLTQATAHAENLAHTLEAHAERSFHATDLALQTVVDAWRRSPKYADGSLPRSEALRLHDLTNSLSRSSEHLRTMRVIDRNGKAIVDSLAAEPRPLDVSDRSFFTVHRDTPDRELFIAEPARLTNLWSVPASRRLTPPDEAFEGVAAATIDPVYFESFYRRIRLPPDSVIGLYSRAGALLVRHPAKEALRGRSMPATGPFAERSPGSATGTIENLTMLDGVVRTASYRVVENYPLVVVVGTSRQALLSPWRESTRESIAQWAAAMAAVALLAILLIARIDALEVNELRLELARDEADRANRVKSDFLARMSHELRTPLNAVIALSDMMVSGAQGAVQPPIYREYANLIHDSGGFLLNMIDDILDLSKIEAGAFELVEGEHEMGEPIGFALSMVRGQAEKSGVALEVSADPRLRAVRGDGQALRQILINLLSNAIKFSPRGATVTIATSIDDEGRPCVAVIDRGQGIALEAQAQLFAAYVQAGAKVRHTHGGTGLGLAICKKLVELHGGEIGLDSAPGAGTTVTMRRRRRVWSRQSPSPAERRARRRD